MASGLLALFDDVATIAKVASASLDDVVKLTAKAGGKAAGIVIDDAAVTPRYVVGFAAERELPIIGRIAWGSTRNKLVVLLPGALLLSTLAPWSIMPLLILGGAYLCYEGFGKVRELIVPPAPPTPAETLQAGDAEALERQKIAGAIRTDFILSAEIIVITLGTVAAASLSNRLLTLVAIAAIMTVGVYGLVAGIVKLDDAGLHLNSKSGNRAAARFQRAIGAAILRVAPWFMKILSVVGTAAMFMVGGSILTHGIHVVSETFQAWSATLAPVPAIGGTLAAIAPIALAAIFGVIAGIAALGLVLLAKRVFKRRPLQPA